MTSARPTPINDDHGDQFPGALPARTTSAPRPADERLTRMHAAYVQKANALVQAGRDSLTGELADAFAAESSDAHAAAHGDTAHGSRRAGRRRAPTRGQDGRGPGRATTRLGRLTRTSLERFDRYTLEVFNAGTPSRGNDR